MTFPVGTGAMPEAPEIARPRSLLVETAVIGSTILNIAAALPIAIAPRQIGLAEWREATHSPSASRVRGSRLTARAGALPTTGLVAVAQGSATGQVVVRVSATAPLEPAPATDR
jgi:hypothetical protein